MSGRFSRTIYVGNLPLDITEWEVEDLFYEDADAIRGRYGYNFDGCRLRVELAHGGRGQSSSSDRRGGYGDHMPKAGDVCFAEVSRDREGTFGLVDYTNYEDKRYAIREINDTEFRNPWIRTYIRVERYDSSPSRSPSRSRSRSRSVGRNRRTYIKVKFGISAPGAIG